MRTPASQSFSPNIPIAPVYAALIMVWALTPLTIVWSIAEIPVLWSLLIRFFFAFPLMLVVTVLLRVRVPLDRTALHSYVAGSLNLIISQTFTYSAASHLSSGMVALMFGFAPIVAGLIGFFVYRQRLYGIQWLGMLVAISGLYVISTAGQEARVSVTGLLLMVGAIVCYAASIFWVKDINAKVSPLAQATGSIGVSTLLGLFYIPFVWHSFPREMPGTRTILAIAYLVVVATVLAMFFYFFLIQKMAATTVSLATVITPMLAIFFGIVLNDEHFRVSILLGSLVVISGLLLYFYRDIMALREARKHARAA